MPCLDEIRVRYRGASRSSPSRVAATWQCRVEIRRVGTLLLCLDGSGWPYRDVETGMCQAVEIGMCLAAGTLTCLAAETSMCLVVSTST